jgi:hypothetical protein
MINNDIKSLLTKTKDKDIKFIKVYLQREFADRKKAGGFAMVLLELVKDKRSFLTNSEVFNYLGLENYYISLLKRSPYIISAKLIKMLNNEL